MIEVLLQLFISALFTGIIYSLMAIGLSIIFGVVRVINFAHGEFVMLAMYVTFFVFRFTGIDPYLSVFITMPLFFLIGVILHKGIIKHILQAPQEAQVIATFGVAFIIRYGAALFWSSRHRSVVTPLIEKLFYIGPITMDSPHLMGALLAGALIFALFIFLYYTYLGRAIRAVADEKMGAMTAGINVDRIYYIAIGIGMACVAVSGAAIIPIESVFPTLGSNYTLLCFVIVVLGGMGNLWGSLLAGIIIAQIEMLVAFFFSPVLTTFAYFVVFLVVVTLRPTGLLGFRERVS
ncbi:MAG: branched-chain amino acid ABC transporter permease [Deltaproteobacteria bacterium]|nr:branched-chain amino acid ABC transporter permease [Deltaproteobacteria bacterium]